MQKNIQPTRIGLDMPSSRREIEEDILEELCRFSQEENMLTFQNLSEQLNISEKELTYYIRQMKRHGYVELSPEGTQVCLTELGRIIGAECRYRHETFMQFLQYVGVENDTAREDACRIHKKNIQQHRIRLEVHSCSDLHVLSDSFEDNPQK